MLNPKHSTIADPRKKINSIPVKTRMIALQCNCLQ